MQAPDIDAPKTLISAEIMKIELCYNFEKQSSHDHLKTQKDSSHPQDPFVQGKAQKLYNSLTKQDYF
jgi:hypothetical protein